MHRITRETYTAEWENHVLAAMIRSTITALMIEEGASLEALRAELVKYTKILAAQGDVMRGRLQPRQSDRSAVLPGLAGGGRNRGRGRLGSQHAVLAYDPDLERERRKQLGATLPHSAVGT